MKEGIIGERIEPSDRSMAEIEEGKKLEEKLPTITAEINERLARLKATMLSGNEDDKKLGLRSIAKANKLLEFLKDIGV